MKIRYALLSCNSKMGYLGWWPAVARAWRRLGITPVLFFIRDSDSVKPPPADGIVHELELLDDVAVSVQYTWARFWGASLYPDDVVIIADMDMLPLSADYFVGQLENIADDEYVHLHALFYNHRLGDMRPGVTAGERGVAPADIERLLAWYHVARGGLMKEVLALPDDWGRSAREVQPCYRMSEKSAVQEKSGILWGGDEIHVTAKIKSYRRQSVFRLLVRQKDYPAHDLPWIGSWRQWAAADRCIDATRQLTHDPSRLKRGYYLDVWVPRPCTPELMARVDLLIKGESCPPTDEPVHKWEKHILVRKIAEYDCIRHGMFLAEARSAFRLLAIYFQKNRSPRDAAWSRYVRNRVAEMARGAARSLLAFFRR